MGRRGNLAIFESSNISETGEVMPIKIGVIQSFHSHHSLTRGTEGSQRFSTVCKMMHGEYLVSRETLHLVDR